MYWNIQNDFPEEMAGNIRGISDKLGYQGFPIGNLDPIPLARTRRSTPVFHVAPERYRGTE